MSNFNKENKPCLIHVNHDIKNREIVFSYVDRDGKGAMLSFTEKFLGKIATRRLLAVSQCLNVKEGQF